jgi:hypothetical protein
MPWVSNMNHISKFSDCPFKATIFKLTVKCDLLFKKLPVHTYVKILHIV